MLLSVHLGSDRMALLFLVILGENQLLCVEGDMTGLALSLSLFSQENKSLDYLWFFFVLVFMTGVVHSMLVILHFVSNILSLSHNGFKLCS